MGLEGFLEEEGPELSLGGAGGRPGEELEKGILGRRNSLWVWGPSGRGRLRGQREGKGPSPGHSGETRPRTELLSPVLDAGACAGRAGWAGC